MHHKHDQNDKACRQCHAEVKRDRYMGFFRKFVPSCFLKPSPSNQLSKSKTPRFYAIPDRFSSIEEVQQALRSVGLESSNLILGIDYTKSNKWTGAKTFNGDCLHAITPHRQNPYQEVISVIGRTLEAFDDDRLIPTFGFGDNHTSDKKCFSFYPDNRPCFGFQEVLSRYSDITPCICLAGPTNFAPVIHSAISIAREERSYHILLIICDGQVTNRRETEEAIVEASRYPLSIVVVGVGTSFAALGDSRMHLFRYNIRLRLLIEVDEFLS